MNKLERIREKIELKYPVLNPNIRKEINPVKQTLDIILKQRKDKIIITFSMDKKIVEELRYYCEKEGMYVSGVVERAVKKYLGG